MCLDLLVFECVTIFQSHLSYASTSAVLRVTASESKQFYAKELIVTSGRSSVPLDFGSLDYVVISYGFVLLCVFGYSWVPPHLSRDHSITRLELFLPHRLNLNSSPVHYK